MLVRRDQPHDPRSVESAVDEIIEGYDDEHIGIGLLIAGLLRRLPEADIAAILTDADKRERWMGV